MPPGIWTQKLRSAETVWYIPGNRGLYLGNTYIISLPFPMISFQKPKVHFGSNHQAPKDKANKKVSITMQNNVEFNKLR